ncbi:hypothetical protein [Robiginitalea sediminis]|uniref:hypothetical protein n=1 Tax=Robiginitalea sediminis TaxID=1982593 RepID=UPI000B4B4061|nr:hypothetical protein [Robiginitalea sediminis]
MKRILLWVFPLLFLPLGLHAQLNAYKYVVVPLQFEDFKQMNQHQTSTTVKFYLEQYGLPVIYDNAKPRELMEHPCRAAYVKMKDKSGLLATRLYLQVVDCEGQVLMESEEGRSKEKDFKEAYREAIEQATLAFAGLNYRYDPPTEAAPESQVAEASPNPSAASVKETVETVVSEPAPAAENAAAELPVLKDKAGNDPDLLYAQAIEGGYQLVDRTPRVHMLLMASARDKDVYMAVKDGASAGTVYREGDQWVHEYFEAGEMVRKTLNIKF